MGGWVKLDVGQIDSDFIRASGRAVGDTFCAEGASDPDIVFERIDANANATCDMDDQILELRRCFHDGPSVVSIFSDRGRLAQREIVSGDALESSEIFVGSFTDAGDQVAVIDKDGTVSIYRWDEDGADKGITSGIAAIDARTTGAVDEVNAFGAMMTGAMFFGVSPVMDFGSKALSKIAQGVRAASPNE